VHLAWLKFSDVSAIVAIAEETGVLADGYHIKLMMMHAPHLCYGAYEGDKLVGSILAVPFERSVMIKHFMVHPASTRQGIGRRLFETLLGSLQSDYVHIYIHATPEMVGFFGRYDFVERMRVGRYMNVGKVPPFNFTNAHAKELDGTNFDAVMSAIDRATFGEIRTDFLHDEMERNSSLKFALPHGFMHSSVVNARHVYLGPWQVLAGFEEEAEKMMRGVLYFRGLKKVVADIPLEMAHVVALYERYHFAKKSEFVHMTWGEPSQVVFENIYAFSL